MGALVSGKRIFARTRIVAPLPVAYKGLHPCVRALVFGEVNLSRASILASLPLAHEGLGAYVCPLVCGEVTLRRSRIIASHAHAHVLCHARGCWTFFETPFYLSTAI